MRRRALSPCRRAARGGVGLLLTAAAWLAARPLDAGRLPGFAFVAPERGHAPKKVAAQAVSARALELPAAHRAALRLPPLPPVQPLDDCVRKQDGFQAMLPYYSGFFVFQLVVFLSLVDWAA